MHPVSYDFTTTKRKGGSWWSLEGAQAHSTERRLGALIDLTCLSSSTPWLSRIDLARIECSRKRVGVVTGVRHGSSSPPDARMISWISFGRPPSLRTRSSLSTLRSFASVCDKLYSTTLSSGYGGEGRKPGEDVVQHIEQGISFFVWILHDIGVSACQCASGSA